MRPGHSNNNYVHDTQCVKYHGPDKAFAGREICFGSNENAVVIYDVTDKPNPIVHSQTTYPTAGYTHQGWLTQDRKWFVFDAPLDAPATAIRAGGRGSRGPPRPPRAHRE